MKLWRFFKKLIKVGIIAAIVMAFIYFLFVRPWIFRMGATDGEVSMQMPGDGLVDNPSSKYTQAITINAPKEYVWAYLIQMGHRRGGWYNLDFINRMADKNYFYENNRSADRIIPKLQSLKEGDEIKLSPQIPGLNVAELKKNEYMLLTMKENGGYFISWLYALKEVDKDTTRLYVRWASKSEDDFITKATNLLIFEPGGSGIQQSLNMRGIKKRAEAEYLNTQKKPGSDK